MAFSDFERQARILQLEAELSVLRREQESTAPRVGPVDARRLFEACPIGLALCRMDGQLIDVNPAFATILGRTVADTLGLSYWDITPPGYAEKEARQLDLLERTGRFGPYTKHYIHREGHIVAVRLNGLIIEAAGERYIWSSAEDITDMARAANALRESEERYRSVVETTGEWIWELNLAFKHTYSNHAVLQILGYTPEEFLSLDTLALMHPEDAEDVGKKLPELMANKAGWRGWLIRWQHRDGSYRYVESSADAILDTSGELRGYRGADRDITHRIQLEKQLRHSQKMDAVGKLAGGIAHDFNNLLVAILGHADLLADSVKDDPIACEDLEGIRLAGQWAASLTQKLLAFSRRQMVSRVQMDLNSVAHDCARLLGRVIGENIQLRTELHSGPLRICADPGEIEQIVINLVTNAGDAVGDGGEIRLRTDRVQIGAESHAVLGMGEYAVLEVSDNGSGIAAEILTRIFEPFFTTKAVGLGTGLGLSTVYGIVKQLGGDVEIDSEVGRGTRVGVLLPLSEAPVQTPVIEAPAAAGGSERILVVDDEMSVAVIVARVLEAAGYVVEGTRSAKEALARFEAAEHSFDLLLSDVVMPNMSGIELAGRIREVRPDIRVLLMSGYAPGQDLERLDVELLKKPFSPSELLGRVRSVLDAGRS